MTDIANGANAPASHAEGPAGNQRFVVLDGIRGVAALMVMVMHSTRMFPNADLAVDLFFMLSGFVLAHGYGDRLGTAADRRRFVIARLIRLYPLYLAGCLIALPSAIGMAYFGWDYWTMPVLALSVITAPFFILLPIDGFSIPLNQPGWSLSFELIANALFLWTAARPARFLPVIAISIPLLLLGMSMYHGGPTGWHSFLGVFPRTFFSFFAGVLLYRLWRRGLLPRIPVPAVVILAIVAAMCLLEPRHFRVYQALAVFVVNPLLIWLGATCIVKGFTSRACEYVGMLSYGVYVIHVPVIMGVEGIRFLLVGASAKEFHPSGMTAWIVIPIALVTAHYLSTRFDLPVRRSLATRFLARKPVAPRAGANEMPA